MKPDFESILNPAAWPQLAALAPHWLAKVPLYRQLAGTSVGPAPQADDFASRFRALPIISKADIRRDFPRNFLADGVDLQDLLARHLVELEHTSGTSEESTPLILGQGWWAEQEWAALRLNAWIAANITPASRRVALVSPACSSEINYHGIPACSDRTLGHHLFVNISRHPFAWSDFSLARMVEETLAWQPEFLDMDPVYGVLFARYCERHQVRIPSLKFILSSYEYLSVLHRRILERVFHTPVFNLYGSTETGHLIMEDEKGELRSSSQTALLEIVNADASGIGDLVVSTLTLDFMPLVRYGIGDLVQLTGPAEAAHITLHGRARDALRDAHGQRITVRQIDQCFAGLEGVGHYQLRQLDARRFLLLYFPECQEAATASLAVFQARFNELFKDFALLETRPVDFIACEGSGKFRLALTL